MFEPNTRRNKLNESQAYFKRFPAQFVTDVKVNNWIKSTEHFSNLDINLESFPYRIILEPTNLCNLSCSLCSTGTKESNRGRGRMELENYEKIIDAVSPYAVELYLQNWGEATVHPNFSEIVSYANQKGIWTHLSTNLSLKFSDKKLKEMFIDSGLQILHVGIDGMTQESYEKYRGSGNLSLVLKNLKKVLELRGSRKTPFIRASMLASCYNENEVDQFNELMESMNMDEWSIDKMQVNPNESIEWLPDNEELRYQNYTSIGAEFTKKPCVRLWSEMVINWDGNISACCIVDDKNADFANDINKGSVDLETIWNNSSYLSARSSFTAEPKTGKHTICHECKNMVGSKELSYVGKTFSLKLESTKLE